VIKFIVMLQRRQGMTLDGFARYWREVHVPLARDLPGLRGYSISTVVEAPDGERPYDGVAELWFDDIESLRRSFASPTGERARLDMAQFTDTTRITRAITIEERIVWNEGSTE
jgi:uncharacterized protein (TIGR02118 family)